MKNYDNYNYSRYKADLKASMPEGKFWDEYTRDELIIKFLPLVENIHWMLKSILQYLLLSYM